MTNEDFLQAIMSYFGGFDNDFIAKLCVEEIKELSNKGRKKIFDYLVENVNARFKPDLKEVKKAIVVTGATKVRFCKKCGKQLGTTVCYECEKKEIEDKNNLMTREEWAEVWQTIGKKTVDIPDFNKIKRW